MIIPSIHASCVAYGKYGVLIRGASGSGKSDLVLRLIDSQGFGIGNKVLHAKLVADDQVILHLGKGGLIASAPAALKGKLEIRGQGIVEVACISKVKLVCVVDLVPMSHIERLPQSHDLETTIDGTNLPCLKLWSGSPSAPARLRSYLQETLAKSFSNKAKTR
jgi:HPr kinase/phosphorylase